MMQRTFSTLVAVLFLLPTYARPDETRSADPTPGWHAHFEQKMGVFNAVVESASPTAAFDLGPDDAPHPELRAVGWTATYRGRVRVPAPGSFRFSLEVKGGTAELVARDDSGATVLAQCRADADGRTDSQWAKLTNAVQIEVKFTRSGRGEARLRTLWEQAPNEFGGFRSEPISPWLVDVPSSSAASVSAGMLEQQGRVLLETKGCTNCHRGNETTNHAVGRRLAPDLATTARFARIDWLARWIEQPSKLRAHTDMPGLLHQAKDPALSALDLAHYIKSLTKERAASADWAYTPEVGRKLFHQVGCVACHGPQAAPKDVLGDPLAASAIPTANNPRPFGDLKGKWTRGALAEFLLEPTKLHRDGYMPSLKLSQPEARALADYLSSVFDGPEGEKAVDDSVVDESRVKRASMKYMGLRCFGCHGIVEPPGFEAKDLGTIAASTGGCLDNTAGLARYDWNTTGGSERAALEAGLKSVARATGVAAPLDRMRRTMTAGHCFACHRKDGLHGIDPSQTVYFHALDDRVDLGDEGRLPPDLTNVGFKLHTRWMERVIKGEGVARPYMGVRMPAFVGLDQEAIADGLTREAGISIDHDVDPPTVTDSLVADGKKLVGPTGMNCIGCHPFKDVPPIGSPGPRLDQFAERLRFEWWKAYLQQPLRFKPGTRMPAFSFGSKSTVPNVQGGDIYNQADALYCYFTLGESMPAPEGIVAKDAYKIVVGDHPIVLRAFLEHAGSRGIAVGTPIGIHFGYDADRVRLTEVWQGDFLDASGAWAGRGGTILNGQGRTIYTPPEGPPIVFADAPPTSWPSDDSLAKVRHFKGYAFEKNSPLPVFDSQLDGVRIHERVSAQVAPSLRIARQFRLLSIPKQNVYVNAGEGTIELTNVNGCDARRLEGTSSPNWFELKPRAGASEITFTIEVQP